MTDQAKEARKEYFKKWRKENRDKIRGYESKYWEKKKQSESSKQDSGATN